MHTLETISTDYYLQKWLVNAWFFLTWRLSSFRQIYQHRLVKHAGDAQLDTRQHLRKARRFDWAFQLKLLSPLASRLLSLNGSSSFVRLYQAAPSWADA